MRAARILVCGLAALLALGLGKIGEEGLAAAAVAPFAALLAVLPFFGRSIDPEPRFWTAFTATWLVLLVYLCAFAYAVPSPFTHVGLAADHEATWVTLVSLGGGALLLAALAFFRLRDGRKAGGRQ